MGFLGFFANSRLARMSSGHYCLIRDLGLVKGGKGLRHHEVVLDLSLRGLVRLLQTLLRPERTAEGPLQAEIISPVPTSPVAHPVND